MHRSFSLPEEDEDGGGGGGGFHIGWYGNQELAAEYGSAAIPSYLASLYPLEMAGITDVPLDRALAASRNHREAEKRRRERIKSHLDRLRTLLACDSKIDKATLLARAVEHVRDLKQRTAEIAEIEHFPTETDEISVHQTEFPSVNGRRSIIKASLCCDDRSDLLPELTETLKSLRLKTLRAEIATLGGRVRNVLVVTGEEDDGDEDENSSSRSAGFLREALKALVDRQVPGGERSKRRRILDRTTIS